ncbi:hypothetical protein CMI47_00730 [Candidatus Pacearchaeota archaeon]|nr:hypothetical protein [Candidatus Pacearchaeota archaeon]
MSSGSLALFDLDALLGDDSSEKLDLDDLLGLSSECVWEKGTMLIFMPQVGVAIEKEGWICGSWGISSQSELGRSVGGQAEPYTSAGRALHHLPTGMRAANTRTIKQAKCMAEGIRSLLPFLEEEGSAPSGFLAGAARGEKSIGGPRSRFGKALTKERHEVASRMTSTSLRAQVVNLYRQCMS